MGYTSTLILAYEGDPAAVNIYDKLLEHLKPATNEIGSNLEGSVTLRLIDHDPALTNLRPRIRDIDRFKAVIIVSRHESRSGMRTLTVHAPGNLGEALLGGEPRKLAVADAQRMKTALMELKVAVAELNLDYEVTLEATHHGPTDLHKPVFFVEIGSSESQWTDEKAVEAAARAALRAATHPTPSQAAVGFGGGHYPEKHTKISLETDVAVGHVLPKYFFSSFDVEVVEQAFQKTYGSCQLAVVDRKGIKSNHKRTLLNLLRDRGIRVMEV
ncbi:MAG: D-aminoacyl-tRNA deacylase [Candidatus Bathyarchaeia archaeon]